MIATIVGYMLKIWPIGKFDNSYCFSYFQQTKIQVSLQYASKTFP